jgi:hypothetical protein
VIVSKIVYIGEVEGSAVKSLKKFEEVFLRTKNLKFGIFLSARRLFDLLHTHPFDKILLTIRGCWLRPKQKQANMQGFFPLRLRNAAGLSAPIVFDRNNFWRCVA